MIPILILLLILVLFGGLGFANHLLWLILLIALVVWAFGYRTPPAAGGRRSWYGRY
jgi:hypothetical protein